MPRTLFFHRDFQGYTGGHGKVRDYFGHALAHPAWSPRIFLTAASRPDGNPWHGEAARRLDAWRPQDADALFLAGLDWAAGTAAGVPVVNLVQGLRHAERDSPLYGFLARPAIRICVSHAVADAIASTGRVEGPVHVIPAALDFVVGDAPRKTPGTVYVGAQKQPELGEALAARLRAQGRTVVLGDCWLPREAYLRRLAEAEVAVLLPLAAEGFYLPGVEAMALGCAVVLPDCGGNREYLEPGANALSPPTTVAALAEAVAALDDDDLRRTLAAGGRATAARFDPAHERAAFHRILDTLGAAA